MVNACSVSGCSNEPNPVTKRSFFGFPFRRPEIFKLWLRAAGKPNWSPAKTSKICSDHFLESDYELRPGCYRKSLKYDAVPSVFFHPKQKKATGPRTILQQKNPIVCEENVSTEAYDESTSEMLNIQSSSLYDSTEEPVHLLKQEMVTSPEPATSIQPSEIENNSSFSEADLNEKINKMNEEILYNSKSITSLEQKNWAHRRKIQYLTSEIMLELRNQNIIREEQGGIILQNLGSYNDLVRELIEQSTGQKVSYVAGTQPTDDSLSSCIVLKTDEEAREKERLSGHHVPLHSKDGKKFILTDFTQSNPQKKGACDSSRNGNTNAVSTKGMGSSIVDPITIDDSDTDSGRMDTESPQGMYQNTNRMPQNTKEKLVLPIITSVSTVKPDSPDYHSKEDTHKTQNITSENIAATNNSGHSTLMSVDVSDKPGALPTLIPINPPVSSQPQSDPVVTSVTKDNFPQLCRCCVIRKGELDVFETHYLNTAVSEMLQFCLNETILTTDKLPRTICQICLQHLINSYSFLKKIRVSQDHIRDLQNIFLGKLNDDSIVLDDNTFDEEIQMQENANANIDIEIPPQKKTFKEEFKGIRRIYSELCDVLAANRREIRRSITTTKKRRLPDTLHDVEGVNDVKVEEEMSGEFVRTSEYVSNENELLQTLQNSEALKDVRVDSEETHEDIEPYNFVKIEENYQMGMEEEERVEEEAENVDAGEGSPIIESESLKIAVDDNLVNLEICTIPGRILDKNLEKLVEGGFNDFKIGEDGQLVALEGEEKEEPEPPPEPLLKQCFECLEVFKLEKELTKHAEETGHVTAHRFKCSLCPKTFANARAHFSHQRRHKVMDRRTLCEICGAYVLSNNMNRHSLVHKMKNNMCQFCGKAFTQKGNLTDHLNKLHLGVSEILLCFICGKSLRSVSELNKHINDAHIDEDLDSKSYKCDKCGKYFVNEFSLSLHQKYTHEKRRTKFSTRYDKMLPREGDPEKKAKVKKKVPFKKFALPPKECPVCHKVLGYTNFRNHMLIHQGIKPHQCEVCHKKFRQPCHLKSHMNLHLDIKPYECKYCFKKFRHLQTLKEHTTIHTRETRYSCPICDERFRTINSMKRHKLAHFKQQQKVQYVVEEEEDSSSDVEMRTETESSDSDDYRE